MKQGSKTLEVIKDDGNTVNVMSYYAAVDKKDHVHRAKTRITSKFFTVTSGSTPDTITITGTAEIALKAARGRRLAENGRSLQTEEQEQGLGRFSFDVNLSPDSGDTSVDDVSAAIA